VEKNGPPRRGTRDKIEYSYKPDKSLPGEGFSMSGARSPGPTYPGFGNFPGIEPPSILTGNGMSDALDREAPELAKELDSFARRYITKHKPEAGGEGYDFFAESDEDPDLWGSPSDEACETGGGGEADASGAGPKRHGISEVADEI
jgi:hypothetical protein